MDSNNIYHLYLKTHNVTGFKYLGVTKQDPYLYNGSGIIWKAHLKKHGYNIKTEILSSFNNKDDLRKAGIKYSNLLNIVESKDFANLTIEKGQGGNTWNKKGRFISNETKLKMSVSKKGVPKEKEHREKLQKHLTEHNKRNRSNEEKEKLAEGQRKTRCKCLHCNFESTLSHVKRHMNKTHFLENLENLNG